MSINLAFDFSVNRETRAITVKREQVNYFFKIVNSA